MTNPDAAEYRHSIPCEMRARNVRPFRADNRAVT